MISKQVLVTGATGFLGRHLTTDLIQKNYQVSILARKSSDLTPFQGQNIRIKYGDINDRLALLQATENMDIVFHLAGYIAYKKSERQLMEKINVDGTANVIDACITNNVKQLLYLSSVVAIGASHTPKSLNEDTNFNLSSYDLGYFETKKKAEELVVRSVTNDNLNSYIINPSTIYGAGDATKGSRKTQVKVAKGQFKLYPPGGVNVVYIQDVIQAIHLCLEKGRPGRRYIISGENMTIKELFTLIAQCSGVPAPNIPIPPFLLSLLGHTGDFLRKLGKETSLSSETAVTSLLYHWFSNQRAIDELGFKPTPARKAIEESVSWMKENGLLKTS